jgi:hypothetical protein
VIDRTSKEEGVKGAGAIRYDKHWFAP